MAKTSAKIVVRCSEPHHGKRGRVIAVFEKRGNRWRDAPPRRGSSASRTEVYRDKTGNYVGAPSDKGDGAVAPAGSRIEHVVACDACGGYGVGATEVHRSFRYGSQSVWSSKTLSDALDAARHAGASSLTLAGLRAIIQGMAVVQPAEGSR